MIVQDGYHGKGGERDERRMEGGRGRGNGWRGGMGGGEGQMEGWEGEG